MKKVVLDSNQFIFALRDEEEFCAKIIKLSGIRFETVISETIINEVFSRLKELENKDFASFIIHAIKNLKIKIYDDTLIPSTMIKKYLERGAKKGDASIAAFTEWIQADYLVTENRHFLRELEIDAFETINAEDFMGIIKGRDS